MKFFAGLAERFQREKTNIPSTFGDFGETDDYALARRMRMTAVKLHVSGRGSLRLSKLVANNLRDRIAEAGGLRNACVNGGSALERLVQDARLMESCAEQARLDGVKDLPSASGTPRIAVVADTLCAYGDVKLTRDRLTLAIASFDDVQALEMAELWAIPEAIRISLVTAYMRVAASVCKIAAERYAAEKWIAGENIHLARRSPAFFEHALQLLAEQDNGEQRARLEQYLTASGTTIEQIVQAAHGEEAVAQMRLDNIITNKRLIDALDWQLCFELLSNVEGELNNDPIGVYPKMEDESRAEVRRQVAQIARRLKLAELTVARHAVNAAYVAKQENGAETQQTVCYWLCDDDGRSALLERMGERSKLPRIIADPTGTRTAACICVLAAAIFALLLAVFRQLWTVLLAIPLAWYAAMLITGRVYPRLVPPMKLLKLDVQRVPAALRTLVVMPVLLSSRERAEEICAQFEALGCMVKDENIQFLLLGDFSDAAEQHMPGDGEIVDCVRRRIERMNARAGRAQYFYLHRERSLLEIDERWMGHDRKRGALLALNRLLLNKENAEQAFMALETGEDARAVLKNRFRYVLTIDADTRFLPGAIERLIGTLAHPLNQLRMENGARKGYALLQPQMEMAAGACVNEFVRLFAGNGGLNTYPVSVSNLWQDATGEGIFGGKGIYDVRAFTDALEGALPEGKILSHDLIEGTLARAALVNDVSFYDGFPPTLTSFMRRLNRWTRGDWQLLPTLFTPKLPGDRALSFAARIRLLDNLLRSLYAPALLTLFTGGVWFGDVNALLTGFLFAFLVPLLNLFSSDTTQWRRAVAELAILPITTQCMSDAIVRTLWRVFVSGQHLLDWVTSADSERTSGKNTLPSRIAAILLVPGLLISRVLPATVALCALFTVAPEWIQDMEQAEIDGFEPFSAKQLSALTELAQRTWRFFETYVDAKSNALPPDNVQFDPNVGAARRTSPTNIGLYLMSCLSAWTMGFIAEDELLRRMEKTIASVEQMEDWKGHLYNWYDIDSLRPLSPRYVSSVDSGNFAAALMLCAAAVREMDICLSRRLTALAKRIDFTALYDADRGLFVIGMDAEHDRLSGSHYDLLASESRILSYTAMMLGGVPVKHWSKLSRAAVALDREAALISWSGTMFEYLMPELFMHAPRNTLLGKTATAAIQAQRKLGKEKGRPWGVSESGYYAFDLSLNYQYRAFGLRALALGNNAPEDVVAPYASVLALCGQPQAAAENIRAMCELGWMETYGFCEAVDYLHSVDRDRPKRIRSYMAHHQGMILCSLCNTLHNGAIRKAFMSIPEARALELLLEEKPVAAVKLRRRAETLHASKQVNVQERDDRVAKPEQRLADVHLLSGSGASAVLTADGAVHYLRHGIAATRFAGDLIHRTDGACVHIRNDRTGESAVIGQSGRIAYEPGRAVYTMDFGSLKCEMAVCISPEDGALIKRILLQNEGENSETVRVSDCAPVALSAPADMRAHPVFRHLFVESARLAQCAVAFRRRPREKDENCPTLVHLVSSRGNIQCETDYERLVGRMGSTMRAGGIATDFSNSVGTVLNPCSALQTWQTIAPNETAELHFAFGLIDDENASQWIERNFVDTIPERAAQLATMQARAMLGFLAMEPRKYHLLQRCSALLLDGHLAQAARPHRGEALPLERETLWAMGISGDLPVLLVNVGSKDEVKLVREAVRIHELYRTLSQHIDLVIVNNYGNDYDQPVRDAISDVISFSHLNEMRGAQGGVHLLDGQLLSEWQHQALYRVAAMAFGGKLDFYVQIRRMLASLDQRTYALKDMHMGESRLPALNAEFQNGYGGFLPDGRYAIDVLPDQTAPAPWANIIANDCFGALLTERGGGFIWHENSRSGRLTAFSNDTLQEGWGWMFWLVDEDAGEAVRLLPGSRPNMPFRVIHGASESIYQFETERLSGEVTICVRCDAPELRVRTTLISDISGNYRLVGFIDWLMGTDAKDDSMLRTWTRDGAGFAAGTADGIGYFAAANARVSAGCGRNAFLGKGGLERPRGLLECAEQSGGWVLNVPVQMQADTPLRTDWVIGWAASPQQAYANVRNFYGSPNWDEIRDLSAGEWQQRMNKLVIHTPDMAVNRMANDCLIRQVLSARIRARTGLYQPGGAFGFRDQLQDMLALLPYEPARVREHILLCAARQFEDGDVMHWWHAPYLGVRTKISDDLLFLPYVTARYVKYTQDFGILNEWVPYLENVAIEDGREDVFCNMKPSAETETLHAHCMRAFRRASEMGVHGLARIGSGDWNDGMNRVGKDGRGESIWLSEFIAACATDYAEIVSDEGERVWLIDLSDRMRAAIEEHGWDGKWYLRAYADNGEKLGSAEGKVCRIDAISQAWSVLAQMDAQRARQSMDAVWRMLVDERCGIIRLLTPPFTPEGIDPGYIRGYPEGVRENGAQYSHAACWVLLALIRMGDTARAHSALKMLLPVNHANTRARADIYRVEPYVMAADIYDGVHAGRGGWSWYTGAAGWLHQCVLELLGFERRGDRVCMGALLGDWQEAAVELQFGESRYKLISRKNTDSITLDGHRVEDTFITLIDDGKPHEAVFPERRMPPISANETQIKYTHNVTDDLFML